jgi:SAM-dependent methyltransferase
MEYKCASSQLEDLWRKDPIPSCRICKNPSLHRFLSLGPTPLANQFLRRDQLGDSELTYPLDVCYCPNCFLVQLEDVVSPEILFRDYVYVSGTSNTLRNHFRALAEEVKESFALGHDSLIVDIGSNDGTLLKYFDALGTRTLGIEPATNIAKIARGQGIETINDFFTEDTARHIAEKRTAKAILATNVFAHVNDLDGFVGGIDALLDEDGVFVIEVPYLLDLLQKMLFDTIYHEHLSYFAVEPLVKLFDRFRMKIVDVKRIQSHGGSVRIYVSRSSSEFAQNESVERSLELEKRFGLSHQRTYTDFASQVMVTRGKLVSMLRQLKVEGKRIVGYGAPAKGNTLLNYCGVGTDVLDYIVDESPLKHGLYTPGTHIVVVPTEHIREDRPDYALLLAWNYAKEIFERERDFRRRGGKFIVPIPNPTII